MFRARVVDVRPEANGVDIVLLADGRRFPGVPVLSGFAGGDFGFTGFGAPSETGYDARGTRKRDVFAVGAFIEGRPIILGFYYPQVGQMQFEDKGRMVFRHPSDLYVTVDDAANMEVAHPSGLFVRIGEGTAHEDLSGQDYDGRWKIERNTKRKAHVHIEQPGGASIDIAPSGKITITTPATVKVDAGGVDMDTSLLSVSGAISSGVGASGSFTTPLGQIVTVDGGQVTNITG